MNQYVHEYITDFLKSQNVKTVFGFAGGSIIRMMDSLGSAEGIDYITLHHEQAVAFAAEGYARIIGGLGAALVTNGPGASNLLTGIGDAYCDSIPVLYLCGQASTREYRKNPLLRQNSFQELDMIEIAKSITKYCATVMEPERIRYHLERACTEALSGRRGPVLLDIPTDVQLSRIDTEHLTGYHDGKRDAQTEEMWSGDIGGICRAAKRPIVLAGGGIRLANAVDEFRSFLERTQLPVVYSYMGKDAVNDDDPYCLGAIGMHGHEAANAALKESDLVLAFGTRLDSRQIGKRMDGIAPDAQLIRVEIDEKELTNRIVSNEIHFHCGLGAFLTKTAPGLTFAPESGWLEKAGLAAHAEPHAAEELFFRTLSEIMPEDTILAADVGNNLVWTIRGFCTRARMRCLISGGLGSMGFSFPAAIGACFAAPNAPVVSISGDGGFQLNIQELQTVREYGLPIKMIVMNNRRLDMICDQQKQYCESVYTGTNGTGDYSSPSFQAVATAYGIRAAALNLKDVRKEELAGFLLQDGPALLEIVID